MTTPTRFSEPPDLSLATAPEVRVLSLWQPWATLMAIGAKRVETRSWDTRYRGLVAIHAGVRALPLRILLPRERQALLGRCPEMERWATLPAGVVIAVGVLEYCWVAEKLHDELLEEHDFQELAFGDFAAGRHAWEFTGMLRLRTPVRHRGQLGLTHASLALRVALDAQLPSLRLLDSTAEPQPHKTPRAARRKERNAHGC